MIATSTLRAHLAALSLAAASPSLAAGPTPPPPRPAAPQASAYGAREETDGEKVMGGWAMVVFNTRAFDFPNTGGQPPIPLTVYTLGLRHWTTRSFGPFRNWGVDLGMGLAYGKSKVTAPQTGTLVTSDGPTTKGFGLHAGLPLAVTHHKHATFEIVPEADLIWASEWLPPLVSGGDPTSYSGWSFRMGARAGFEIFFGFIGIPQLAIEASVGLMGTYDKVTSKTGVSERTVRTYGVATNRGSDPWTIFTGSVAAMYHF